MRAYIYVACLLSAIFGAIGAYQYVRISAFANADFTPPPVTIAAAYAQPATWEQNLEAVGTIKALRGVELASETSGEITGINFRSGDHVDVGQELVVLNDDIEQASRRNQVASLDLARLLFERDAKLIKQKSIPESQYDRSKADLEKAKAQLAETEARIRNKRIQAPFSGIIGIRKVDVGDYVSAGTEIATLQDLAQLEIDFTLPARFAPLLKAGLGIELTVAAFAERQIPATLTAVDSRVNPDTSNILVRASIEDSQGLLPGMFASVTVTLGTSLDILSVPETAITYSIQGNTVYVINTDDQGTLRVSARIVKAGAVRDGRIAITKGLEAGERVVTAGQNKLYGGALVQVDESVTL